MPKVASLAVEANALEIVRMINKIIFFISLLVFYFFPAPGTKIDVTYELGTLRDNVRETPIILKNFKVIQQVKVKLNDQEASEQDYSISRAANQTPILNLAPHVFDDSDPYGIRARGGLDIFINYQFR